MRDAERALRFYERMLGAVPVYRAAGFVQAQTPASRYVLVFEEGGQQPGGRGGIAHCGFRVTDPADIEKALAAGRRAGACSARASPTCSSPAPTGCEVETWYEPAPLDP